MTADLTDRTYPAAVMDRLAEAAAALYTGLVSRGVPEATAAYLVAVWLNR